MRRQRVTSHDVAETAGVSRTTVSLVLNGRAGGSIPEETRRRVREVASRLGYRPNAPARALARGRTDIFGIVLFEQPSFDRAGQFFQRTLLDGLLHAVLRAGRNPMLYAHWPGASSDLHSFGDGRADAFLLLAAREEDPLLAYLATHRLPFVSLGRRMDASLGSWVDVDHEGSVDAAVGHLAQLGHRRIAHLAGASSNPAARARCEAFRRAMAARGLPVSDSSIRDGGFVAGTGEEAAAALLSLPAPPTAIFSANDQMAMGAYRAARRLGLSIPRDLSIIGFDDADYAQALDPPLTTVRYPLFPMADAAVELLTELLLHPEHPPRPRVFPTELIVRGSAASP
jgi:LacI family transcriptional regulator, galactose operon repressor